MGSDLPESVVSRYTVTATGFSGVATTAFDDDDASFAIDRQPATGSGSANAGQPYEFTTTASVDQGQGAPDDRYFVRDAEEQRLRRNRDGHDGGGEAEP